MMQLMVDYKKAKGSVQFPYKGYVLSVSNKMSNYPEGVVFLGEVDGRNAVFDFSGDAEGLKKAMQKVDRLVRKAEKEN